MIPMRDEILISGPRVGSPSSIAWLYLLAEFLIGAALSGSFAFLRLVKSVLPKPPRDIAGDVVLVTGVTSTLGKCMAEEFASNGCTIICVDSDSDTLKEIRNQIISRYPKVTEVSPEYRKNNERRAGFIERAYSYECDVWNRDAIRGIANRIKDEIGPINILVTCAGKTGQDIFDTVNTTLMSHYWTVFAFLPSMLQLERAYVVGVTPTTSNDDAYAGSRAAVAGLMESLGQEYGSRNSQLNFITVAPKANPRLLKQSEQQVARDVVQAVKRNQCTLNANWFSTFLYRISCAIHTGITSINRWLHTQGCEYPY